MENENNANTIKVAVVTGNHPYDVFGFQDLFRSMADLDCYIQSLQEFGFVGFLQQDYPRQHYDNIRKQYDVVVFYNMHKEIPPDPGEETYWWDRGCKKVLESLGETRQGIVILHHALLAFPEWQLWSDIVGIQDRSFKYAFDTNLVTEVADVDHPITNGLKKWEMIDEIYIMNSAGPDSQILLTTEHPESMHTLAWTRTYKNARVFCYEGGHDNQTFENPNFRRVLARGIKWAARRL